MGIENTHLQKLLIREGIVTKEQIADAVRELDREKESPGSGTSLTNILVKMGYTTIDKIEEALKKDGPNDTLPEEVKVKSRDNRNNFGKYVVLDQLGKGGMGVVYKAFDTSLKRYVAIKFLESIGENNKARLQKEAETLARLKHNNIIPVYEISRQDNRHYIAMQYVDGTTLDQLIGKLNLRDHVKILEKVAGAIDYAHSQGVIHRDIKPHNILISKEGEVYISDFGIAKTLDPNPATLTNTGGIIGSPHYMSPEQARGKKTDIRTDVYSLGATLYHCCTGLVPFAGETSVEIINNILRNDPVLPGKLNSKIHKDLEVIIIKSILKAPKHRYQTSRELRNDLVRFLTGEPILARKPSTAYLIGNKLKKHRAIISTAMLTLTVSVVVAIPLLKSTKESGARSVLFKREAAQLHYEIGKKYYDFTRAANTKEARKKIWGYIDLAESEFTKAINTDHTFSDAYRYRGDVKAFKNRFNSAIEDYSLAITYNPNYSQAYYYRMGTTFALIVRKYFLIVEYNPLIKQMQNDLDKLVELNALPEYIKLGEALLIFTKLLKITADLAQIPLIEPANITQKNRDSLTQKLGLLGDMADRIELLSDESIRLNPTLPDGYVYKSIVGFNIKTISKAGEDEKKALINEAIEGMDKALAYEPNTLSVLFFASVMSLESGDDERALEYANTAMDIAPGLSDVLYLFASIHAVMGRKEQATELLRRAEKAELGEKEPSIVINPINKACIKYKLGLEGEAEEDLNRWISALPENKRNIIRAVADQTIQQYLAKFQDNK